MKDLGATVDFLAKKVALDGLLQEFKKLHYFRVLKDFQEHEERDMALLPYLVRPGDMVLDVGANIGIYTRLLSRLAGPSGAVHAIEPVPTTFAILASNLKRLEMPNVSLWNFAASDRDGRVAMEIPAFRGFYRARLAEAAGGEGRQRAGVAPDMVTVGARRLDSVFWEASWVVSFIKCDVEGHELQCVHGALGLIDRHGPAWLMEIGGNPDVPGSRDEALLELFRARGYGAYWFDGKKLRSRKHGDSSVNYFLLKPMHLDRMKEGGMSFPVVP